jgi:hypothetical protein
MILPTRCVRFFPTPTSVYSLPVSSSFPMHPSFLLDFQVVWSVIVMNEPESDDEGASLEVTINKTPAGLHSPEIDPCVVPASVMSAAYVRRQLAIVEEEIEAERLERELHEQRAKEAALFLENEAERTFALAKERFYDESTFRYAVPPGTTAKYSLPSNTADGVRMRPTCLPVPRHLPPNPSPLLPQEELEPAYAQRLDSLRSKHEIMAAHRRAGEFDCEEALFAVDSSDDSDGYDEDFEAEWRDETQYIFSVCRGVEITPCDDDVVTEFGRMADTVKDMELRPCEVHCIWDAVRFAYRQAEPVHAKHWLSSLQHLFETKGFQDRPSIASFCFILSKAALIQGLKDRHKAKIKRWLFRCVFLAKKRIVALREFGVLEPTWQQINASCGGLSRPVKADTFMLNDLMEAAGVNAEYCALEEAALEARLAWLKKPLCDAAPKR